MKRTYDDETLDEMLEMLGHDQSEDNREHLDVLLEALDLYVDRSSTYGQVWKQYGALNNLVRLATKIDRLMKVWWHGVQASQSRHPAAMHKDNLDDGLDAINYNIFFIRAARNGNITGSAPERPNLRLVE